MSTSAAGSLKVEIQIPDGKPLSKFSAKDSATVFGDTIDRVVTSRQSSDLSSVAGRTVRVCFLLKECDLYSFQFAKGRE